MEQVQNDNEAQYSKEIHVNKEEKHFSTRMGFEPTRAEHIGLAVQRLNHSATSSTLKVCHEWKSRVIKATAKGHFRQLKLFGSKDFSHAGN